MARSQWHKFYAASIEAPPDALFRLLSDLPNYRDWLPGSAAYGHTADVEPYPVRHGTRYHDGKPDEPGKDWWGTVTGFQPPGSLDFQHTIRARQLLATIDVHIHYSLEPADGVTTVTRWLLLDIAMPAVFRPLRPLITASFDKENVRTMAALKAHAETRAAALAADLTGPVRHPRLTESKMILETFLMVETFPSNRGFCFQQEKSFQDLRQSRTVHGRACAPSNRT